jgi:DNA anti-recombination protein RmuC
MRYECRIREDSQESVEYAIRMPGTQDGEPVLLPVDAKFPREAWERLEDARSLGDQAAMKEAGNRLEGVIRASAKTIKEKYVVPPTTTGFAVMFLIVADDPRVGRAMLATLDSSSFLARVTCNMKNENNTKTKS